MIIRSSLIGASIIVATAACGDGQQGATEAGNVTVEERETIIDATQVATRDDAQLYAESEFLQADLNMDGKVDRAEFIEYASARAPSPSPTPSQTAGMDVSASPEAQTAEEQFAELSKGDEEISETELIETRVAQFDEADMNGDEALDETERKQFAALTTPKAPQGAL